MSANTTSDATMPVIDLSGCRGDANTRRRIGRAIDAAFQRSGFMVRRYWRGGILRDRRQWADSGELLGTFNIKAADPDQPPTTLSGGNQQKMVLARWLVVAIMVALCVGLLVGAINGHLIAILGLDSIIVTLAGMTLIAGVVEWYAQGLSINTGISSTLTNFGSLQWLTIPRVTYLLVIVAALSWYLIEKTPFGRYLRMIGSNRRAAQLVGLPVRALMFLVFALTGLLAGVAGLLLTARSGGANPLDGPGLLLPGLAAVYLGATTVQPGRFNIIGTILGVFFVAVAVSGLTLCGVPPFVEQLFDGGALLLAVGLSRGLERARGGGLIGT